MGNLFEFLERKFSNVRPVYQPRPQEKRRQQYRRPPVPRWPQLQYNYDRPVDNVIEEQPQPAPVPQPAPPPRHQYRPQYQEPPQQPPPVQHYQQSQQPLYEQPQQPLYEQPAPQDPYRPQHHEYKEPEQPVDIPVVVGTVVHQGPPKGFVRTERTTPPPPTQAAFKYPEYDEIEVITAPPLGGHRHYASTYEVQVGTNFNAGQ